MREGVLMDKYTDNHKAPPVKDDRVKVKYDPKTGEVWTEDGKLWGMGKIVGGRLFFTSTRA